MGIRTSMPRSMPGWQQVLVSLLVMVLGALSAQALTQVDQDLWILYTDYTVAATDLAHVLADVMRYRATIIQALEAPTKEEFERIVASLPQQRVTIERTIDNFAGASQKAHGQRVEPGELQAVRESLNIYFSSATQTVALLKSRWRATSAAAAEEQQQMVERHVADTAGPKLVQVTLAIERLLDTVATVGKDLRNEGTGRVWDLSLALWLGSLVIAGFNLLAGRRLSGPQASAAPAEERPGAHPLPSDSPESHRE